MGVVSNLGFWDGAAGAAITAFVSFVGTGFVRREMRQRRETARQKSLEERLQKWQDDTLAAVKLENRELTIKVEACELRHETQEHSVRVLGLVIKLALPALIRAEPKNIALAQCGQLLRGLPVHPEIPSEWTDLIEQLSMNL